MTHAGGTSTVTVNQRVNGGQWNLLGTYTFNSGTTYKVELSDAVAAGKVAADAIYVVSTAAPAAAFTWTPTLPSAGTWRVMVRWPASSGNTANAQYTVTHAGGTSTVTLNQKQNGGVWMSLGSWSFTPGAGHKVTLAASANGATIADAVLFAGPTVQPANLLYVHADHLGSPQKLTTPSQATVWDGIFDPFGEEVAVTGLAAMPLRFPGQYADEETGFNYNYFRDYDPMIGRYVQSDPIGLAGGFNSYGYVLNSPGGFADPFGLTPDCFEILLTTYLYWRYETEVNELYKDYDIDVKPAQGGLGPDLDPRRPQQFPLRPQIGLELWLLEYTVYEYKVYFVAQLMGLYKETCVDKYTDACGKTETFIFDRYFWEPMGEAKRTLIRQFIDSQLTERTYLGTIGVPFPPLRLR